MNVGTISVVGAGIIGSGIAALFSLSGYRVIVFDINPDGEKDVRKAMCLARPVLQKLGNISINEKSPEFTTVLEESLDGADFVIEALPEEIDIKRGMYQRIEQLVSEDVIVMSSSSGFLPSELQATMKIPGRFLVAHPCNPSYLMPVVELVPGNQTTVGALDRAENLFSDVGKKIIRMRREIPGHLVNRLQAALWREAVYLVREGYASVGDVDRAITDGLGPRWAVCGPHKIFHFAGGTDGIQGFLDRLGPAVEHWWSTLGSPVLDIETSQMLVDGMEEVMQDRSLEYEMKNRDEQVVRVLNLLN